MSWQGLLLAIVLHSLRPWGSDVGGRAMHGAIAEIAANGPAIRKIRNAEVGHLALRRPVTN